MAKKQNAKIPEAEMQYLIQKGGIIHGIIREQGVIYAVPRNMATIKAWHSGDTKGLIEYAIKYDSEEELMADFEVIK